MEQDNTTNAPAVQDAKLEGVSQEPISQPEPQSATDATVPKPANVPAPQHEGDPSFVIFNLDKYMNQKQFDKWLTGLPIKYKKSKKVPNTKFGNVRFENEQDKATAKEIVSKQSIKGATVRVEDKKHNHNNNKRGAGDQGEGSKRKQRKTEDNNNNAEPKTVNDVVAPLWRLPYEEQLQKKEKIATDSILKIVNLILKDSKSNLPDWIAKFAKSSNRDKVNCIPFLGVKESPVRDGYRNKAQFTIGFDRESKPCIGFLQGRYQDGVVSVADSTDCVLISKHANDIRICLGEIVSKSNLPVYDKVTRTGFWRQLTVRTMASGEAMAVVQVNPAGVAPEEVARAKQSVIELFTIAMTKGLGMNSLQWQEYEGVSNAAPPELACEVIVGTTHIMESLLGLKFRISANAFFQVNTAGAEVLYSLVRDWCKATPDATVLDICCGTGTIGQTIAGSVTQVVGIEMSEEAVADAKVNAELNGIKNVHYIAGKVEDKISEVLAAVPPHGSVIGVVDPPRAGLHPDVAKAIRAFERIERLVYVSCDPNGVIANSSALCRAASKTVRGAPFKIVQSVAVDLFPHTDRMELVVLFERITTSEPSTTTTTATTATTTATTTTAETATPPATTAAPTNPATIETAPTTTTTTTTTTATDPETTTTTAAEKAE